MINAIVEGGTTSNSIQVATSAYQMGIGYNSSNRWVYNGENLYTGAYDNLRGIASYLDMLYYITLIRTGAGWVDLAEVVTNHIPMKINALPTRNIGGIVTSMILECYGMTFDGIISWDGTVEYTDWSTNVRNIEDRRTDFVCRSVTRGCVTVAELSSTTDMTFI